MRRGLLHPARWTIVWILALVFAGCQFEEPVEASSESPAIVDDEGRIPALDGPPTRVISLVPSITETILELGRGDLLVARTPFDEDPRIAHLPALGQALDPGLEALIAFEPGLVITWRDEGDRALAERLNELGVATYAVQTRRWDDVRRHTSNLGRILDAEPAAADLVESLEEGMAELSARLIGVDTLSVFYVVWTDPPQTTGGDTFIDEVIRLAGGRSVFDDSVVSWPQVGLEEIVRRDPDVLVVPGSGADVPSNPAWMDEPGWRSLRAVRDGAVLAVDSDLFNRPGPRILESAVTLARFLHPDRF